jgi:hypothetical protein
MKIRTLALSAAALLMAAVAASAQTTTLHNTNAPAAKKPCDPAQPAACEEAKLPWEWGVFFQGGTGVGNRSDYKLYSSGVRLGKILTDEHLGSIFRGRFELAGELIPYWEALTPPPHTQLVTYREPNGQTGEYYAAYGGGNFHGLAMTPAILRWDFAPHGRWATYFQAAGGLIYTFHKFPPDILVAQGQPGGTSVWNFSPQGAFGLQYFVSPHRSIMFEAIGAHISSASLGDKNPGVNASVQFQLGYTWWSKK